MSKLDIATRFQIILHLQLHYESLNCCDLHLGGGRNVEFHYYDWQFFSEHQNDFLVDHNYDITTSKMAFELITTSKRMKRTSKRPVLSEFYILTTYGISTYGILVLTKTF